MYECSCIYSYYSNKITLNNLKTKIFQLFQLNTIKEKTPFLIKPSFNCISVLEDSRSDGDE